MQFSSNQADILPEVPILELVILVRYQLDWRKIVDFLLIAYFWVSPISYCSYFKCWRRRKTKSLQIIQISKRLQEGSLSLFGWNERNWKRLHIISCNFQRNNIYSNWFHWYSKKGNMPSIYVSNQNKILDDNQLQLLTCHL